MINCYKSMLNISCEEGSGTIFLFKTGFGWERKIKWYKSLLYTWHFKLWHWRMWFCSNGPRQARWRRNVTLFLLTPLHLIIISLFLDTVMFLLPIWSYWRWAGSPTSALPCLILMEFNGALHWVASLWRKLFF